MRYIVALTLFAFLACNQDSHLEEAKSPVEEPPTVVKEIIEENEETLIRETYLQIVNAIFQKNEAKLNEFTHPEYGINIITNFEGALPQLKTFQRFSHFDHDEGVRLAFENLDSLFITPPTEESLPNIICEETPYSKEGCFLQETSNKLEQHPWNTNGEFNTQLKFVKWTVLNTRYFTIYLSDIEGGIYLSFIDLRIPCSA